MAAEAVTNRKAFQDYHILEKFEAGIELRGTEVKSVRAGHVQLRGAFARIEKGEVILYGCDIQPYLQASHEQHEPKRPRKLLLHRREIRKLQAETEQAGLSLVALRLYWKKQRLKLELGLGRGKVNADKRADLKKRTQNREVERMLAGLQKRR